MNNFDSKIQSIADKAKRKLNKIKMHDPYADLFKEVRRMTSRDSFVRVH